jgi:hypothetical protein
MNLSSCFLVPKNSTKEAMIESLNETKKRRGFNSVLTRRRDISDPPPLDVIKKESK